MYNARPQTIKTQCDKLEVSNKRGRSKRKGLDVHAKDHRCIPGKQEQCTLRLMQG